MIVTVTGRAIVTLYVPVGGGGDGEKRKIKIVVMGRAF